MEQAVNEANAKRTAEMVRNMEYEELQALVKEIPSDIMFEELARRDRQMTEMVHDIRKIARVGCTNETT